MSFSFPPATKFAPNSRNDAFLARNAASIPGVEREVGISRPLTYDLFKLCFYRCPLCDYLYTAPHTRRRPPCLLEFQLRSRARATRCFTRSGCKKYDDFRSVDRGSRRERGNESSRAADYEGERENSREISRRRKIKIHTLDKTGVYNGEKKIPPGWMKSCVALCFSSG